MTYRRTRYLTGAVLAAMGAGSVLSQTDSATPSSAVLFENVRVFDGKSSALSPPSSVLVRGNVIEKISAAPISVDRGAATRIIDGQGRTLMPGLIDAHAHIMFTSPPLAAALTADIGYIHQLAGRDATAMLMRGFTTIRDMGGPAFGLKRAIDEGVVPGPRIYPSGAMISQTSGHGDFRLITELPREPNAPLSYTERVGAAAIADGVDQVLLRTREQLMQGATQIKLMAGGGVTSPHDPLDSAQYSEEELHAAVGAAADWDTYVAVHVYTPRAMQRAIRAGVKCIEHGQLADEATAKLMAEKGIWWSLQPFLDDEDMNPMPDPASRAKRLQMVSGTETAYKLAIRYKIKTAFGTDTLFSAKSASRQTAQLAKLSRWYTSAQLLRMATADNAELLKMSGERNPYPGKLGVVEEGALADLLLVEGDPLSDIRVIENPATNFVVIMKDGRIYKDLLKK